MSRWLVRNFLKCERCSNVQRHAQGFKEIPNPMYFDNNEMGNYWADQGRIASGHKGRTLTEKCEGCGSVHTRWSVLNHNQYLKEKEALLSNKKAASPLRSSDHHTAPKMTAAGIGEKKLSVEYRTRDTPIVDLPAASRSSSSATQ